MDLALSEFKEILKAEIEDAIDKFESRTGLIVDEIFIERQETDTKSIFARATVEYKENK